MRTLKEFAVWLNEEEARLPADNFSVEELKKFGTGEANQENLIEILRYLKRGLGNNTWEGSFRYTWILDDQRVIKLIKGVDRISQNKQELKNSKCLGTEFAIQVLDYHPQFYWLIEEQVNQLSEQEFIAEFNKKLGTKFGEQTLLSTGYDISTSLMITNIIHHTVINKKKESYKQLYPYFERSDWFMGLVSKLRGCAVSSVDFHYENWGVRPSTGELVILDLGF